MHLHGRLRHRLYLLIAFVAFFVIFGILLIPIRFSELPAARRVKESAVKVPLPTPLVTQTPKSKLGIFILSGLSPGAKKILAAQPSVVKVMDPYKTPGLLAAIHQYKQDYPDGITILRFADQKHVYTLEDDPNKAAEELFATVIRPGIDALGSNKDDYDLIETPNESNQTPGWETVDSARWLGKFWGELTRLNYLKGFHTCIGSIAVGNPGGSPQEIEDKLAAFLPAVQTANRNGGALCYHAYTIQYTTDVSAEQWFSLRYRSLHDSLVKLDPALKSFPIVLSEGGVDLEGAPATAGWQKRGTTKQYEDWLTWFSSEIEKDSYVQGVTLFQIGDSYWSSFDLEPMADWLTSQIRGKI